MGFTLYTHIFINAPPISAGKAYCFRSISLSLCLFLCRQDYEKTAGPICMKFSGKVWTAECPQDDLITFFGQFRETARCRDAQHWIGVCCAFEHSLFIVVSLNFGLIFEWATANPIPTLLLILFLFLFSFLFLPVPVPLAVPSSFFSSASSSYICFSSSSSFTSAVSSFASSSWDDRL